MASRYWRTPFSAAIAIVVAVSLGSLRPQATHAQWGYCDSDPVVVLSNLAEVDLSAAIDDDLSDVSRVVYVLHIPTGTSAISVINTDGLMGLRESLQFVADQPPGTYVSDTTVFTGAPHTAFTATTSVSALPSLGRQSASGYSNHDVTITFAPGPQP